MCRTRHTYTYENHKEILFRLIIRKTLNAIQPEKQGAQGNDK